MSYDPDLFVAKISQTHIVLLNKFNVVDHHLVIVTRSFEPQEALLTREDCAALLIRLAEIDGWVSTTSGQLPGQPTSQTSQTDSVVCLAKIQIADRAVAAIYADGWRDRDGAELAVPACLCLDGSGMARPTEGRRLVVARLLSLAAPRRWLDG
ncbi:MAG: hypothetical protein ABI604_13580 [Nitrospirota bacterium]